MSDLAQQAVELLNKKLTDADWIECNGLFPEPNLIAGQSYPVTLEDGTRKYAKYWYGEDEFWWSDIMTGKELRVVKYSRA